MKSKFLRFAAAALALVAGQAAFAMSNGDMHSESNDWYGAGNWYVGAQGSVGWMTKLKEKDSDKDSIKTKAGWGTGLKFGNTYFAPFRFELEGTFRRNKLKSLQDGSTGATADIGGNVKSYNLMVNALYDFEVMDDVAFYLGGGIGWSHAKLKGSANGRTQKAKSNNFAYQLMAGLDWRFVENWSAFVGYKFFGTTGRKFKDNDASNSKTKYKANFENIIEAGVKFYF